MIAMSYVDKRYAARGALRDYRTMQNVIDITPDAVKAAYEDISAPRTPALSPTPGTGDPLAGEYKLAAAIDDMDIMRERYRAAVEFLAWFEPAWKVLSEQEKLILCEFYTTGSFRSGANRRLQERFGLSRAQIDRKRNQAMTSLSILLYGR